MLGFQLNAALLGIFGLLSLSLSLSEGHALSDGRVELERVADQDDQWWLPEFVNEASGIAVMKDQSILLHDDEFAVIYHVSLVDHSIEPFGWLGSPEFERDFEGIALNLSLIHI